MVTGLHLMDVPFSKRDARLCGSVEYLSLILLQCGVCSAVTRNGLEVASHIGHICCFFPQDDLHITIISIICWIILYFVVLCYVIFVKIPFYIYIFCSLETHFCGINRFIWIKGLYLLCIFVICYLILPLFCVVIIRVTKIFEDLVNIC